MNAMSAAQIRPARADEQALIRQMVREARLDPTELHWSHFVVAEQDGAVIGIGQIRPYRRCRELGSLVVLPAYRESGVGGQIITALLAQETGDVYLECQSRLASYYSRFGFAPIPWWHAPMPLKFKAGFSGMIGRLLGYRMTVMRRDAL